MNQPTKAATKGIRMKETGLVLNLATAEAREREVEGREVEEGGG